MFSRKHKCSSLLVGLSLALTMAISGCGSREMLVPLRGAIPSSVDLTGRWRMRDDFDVMQERIERAISETDGVDEREILRGMIASNKNRQSASRKKVGGLVHVFLENGRNLRISQTDAGLFIAFDRSVVEEYRFGEARMLSKGGAQAQRVSGWEGTAYVIETLDDQGMKLSERYELSSSGGELRRKIALRSAELNEISLVQTFVPAE